MEGCIRSHAAALAAISDVVGWCKFTDPTGRAEDRTIAAAGATLLCATDATDCALIRCGPAAVDNPWTGRNADSQSNRSAYESVNIVF